MVKDGKLDELYRMRTRVMYLIEDVHRKETLELPLAMGRIVACINRLSLTNGFAIDQESSEKCPLLELYICMGTCPAL